MNTTETTETIAAALERLSRARTIHMNVDELAALIRADFELPVVTPEELAVESALIALCAAIAGEKP